MRITEGYKYENYIDNLNYAMEKLAKINEKISSGMNVNKPSDAPEKIGRIIDISTSIANIEQYSKNNDEVKKYLSTTEQVLISLNDLFKRASTIAIKGANETLTLSERQILAMEVDNLLKQALAVANTQLEGKYILSGFKTLTEPFTPVYTGDLITDVNYNGDNGLMPEEVYKGEIVNKNITGNIFKDSPYDIFIALIDLRDNLNSNNTAGIASSINEINRITDHIVTQLTDAGSRLKRVEVTEQRINSIKNTLINIKSKLSDIDMPEVLTKFQMQQNIYQAAITSIAKILQQTTLADILR